jgi:hypothetical protein
LCMCAQQVLCHGTCVIPSRLEHKRMRWSGHTAAVCWGSASCSGSKVSGLGGGACYHAWVANGNAAGRVSPTDAARQAGHGSSSQGSSSQEACHAHPRTSGVLSVPPWRSFPWPTQACPSMRSRAAWVQAAINPDGGQHVVIAAASGLRLVLTEQQLTAPEDTPHSNSNLHTPAYLTPKSDGQTLRTRRCATARAARRQRRPHR